VAVAGAFILGFGLVVVWSQVFLGTADQAAANIKTTGQADTRLFPQMRYGMQVDVGNDMPRAFEMMKDAGFNWTKVQVRWDGIESRKGQPNWSVLDKVIEETSKANVNILFTVVAAPEWSRPANTDKSVPGPPADPNDMANFVRLLTERYKGRVQAIEVWNEQNLWYEWGGVGKMNAKEYVDLLRPVHAAIKSVDPSVIVVAGALTPAGDVADAAGVRAIDDRRFLREMYAAGVKDVSDAIGYHGNAYNNPPGDDPAKNTTDTTNYKGNWSFYFRNYEQYREIMVAAGDSAKQLWFTEFGWASANPPPKNYSYAADNTLQEQADYLVAGIEQARATGYVGALFVWNLNFAPAAEPDDDFAKRAFSIINTDWTPRPAYNALKAMKK
jgi:hypothetical protein